jgi:hypothetical protein
MLAGSSESALYIAEYRRHSTMSTAQAAMVSAIAAVEIVTVRRLPADSVAEAPPMPDSFLG